MEIVTFDQICNLNISPATCCKWVEDGLALKENALLPKKISLSPPGYSHVFYNTMPCIIPKLEIAGVKVVTRYPSRKPSIESQILLYDLKGGECIALMDGTWITTMRTGAVAAHSIKLFARKAFRRVGFIGLGNTARATLLCLARYYFQDKDMEVGVLQYKDQHTQFMERFSALPNVSFREFSSLESLARWSDVIVSSVTSAENDFTGTENFKAGILIVPIHTRGFAECDLCFDRVFCDDISHVSGFKYYPRFVEKLSEVAEVHLGKAPGRQSDSERIIAYNIGIALHDIYFASKILNLANAQKDDEFSLHEPLDGIWV